MIDETILENPNCDQCGFRLLSIFETQSFRCSNCDTDTPWPDPPTDPGTDDTPPDAMPPPPVDDN